MADREEIYIKIYDDGGLKQWREKKKNLKFIKVAIRTSCKLINPFTLQHQSAYSPHCSLYISKGADKENLCKNQELL